MCAFLQGELVEECSLNSVNNDTHINWRYFIKLLILCHILWGIAQNKPHTLKSEVREESWWGASFDRLRSLQGKKTCLCHPVASMLEIISKVCYWIQYPVRVSPVWYWSFIVITDWHYEHDCLFKPQILIIRALFFTFIQFIVVSLVNKIM